MRIKHRRIYKHKTKYKYGTFIQKVIHHENYPGEQMAIVKFAGNAIETRVPYKELIFIEENPISISAIIRDYKTLLKKGIIKPQSAAHKRMQQLQTGIKLHHHIKHYLQTKEVWNKFLNNFETNQSITTEQYYIRLLNNPKQKLLNAFNWNRTQEKYTYWNDMNEKCTAYTLKKFGDKITIN